MQSGLLQISCRGLRRVAAASLGAALASRGLAAGTNVVNPLPAVPPLPDVGASLLRVGGALVLVLALFLGAVWLFRNWQRLLVQRGRAPRLNVLEARSLGGRHALYVVGYDQERFLIAASPGGVNLVSHLQPAEETVPDTKNPPPTSFVQTLTRVLKNK
jgi:flagellar biogenesis protein FliO